MSFTLHLVFSRAGLDAARPLLAETDRLVCMQDVGDVALSAAIACRIVAAPGAARSGGDGMEEIDYPTLARWCADAARVVSWP